MLARVDIKFNVVYETIEKARDSAINKAFGFWSYIIVPTEKCYGIIFVSTDNRNEKRDASLFFETLF